MQKGNDNWRKSRKKLGETNIFSSDIIIGQRAIPIYAHILRFFAFLLFNIACDLSLSIYYTGIIYESLNVASPNYDIPSGSNSLKSEIFWIGSFFL